MTRCLAPDCMMGGLGCDNMTVVIVCFLHGESYEKLAEKCKLSSSNQSYSQNGSKIMLNSNNKLDNLSSINSSKSSSGIQLRTS